MRAVDVIIKKRNKQELSREEIEFFINGFNAGKIPDYQAASWAMAVLLNGMSARETADLTLALVHSGEILDLSGIVPVAVDKHSTGGVGDKTTLVTAPIVAASGLPVGKMSGRGLGFSGGTLDKMESIPGFRTDLSTDEFRIGLGRIGLVLTGQSVNLAPADGKLYALRDVTGTVQSLPLIASSVMSKKIAAGAQGIVLDVKVGLGAFMQTLEEARELASLMVSIAELANRSAVALLSDMNQPLGFTVGNALEVREAVATLQGAGPPDLIEHCLLVASHMLVLGGVASNEAAGRHMAQRALSSGEAWKRFLLLVESQGGDVAYVEQPERLPTAQYIETVTSPRSGYLKQIHPRQIGEASVRLGAGRAHKRDQIDHAVGFEIPHKVGGWIERGQPLFIVHANDQSKLEAAKQDLINAFAWDDQPVNALPMTYGLVRSVVGD